MLFTTSATHVRCYPLPDKPLTLKQPQQSENPCTCRTQVQAQVCLQPKNLPTTKSCVFTITIIAKEVQSFPTYVKILSKEQPTNKLKKKNTKTKYRNPRNVFKLWKTFYTDRNVEIKAISHTSNTWDRDIKLLKSPTKTQKKRSGSTFIQLQAKQHKHNTTKAHMYTSHSSDSQLLFIKCIIPHNVTVSHNLLGKLPWLLITLCYYKLLAFHNTTHTRLKSCLGEISEKDVKLLLLSYFIVDFSCLQLFFFQSYF